MAAAVGVGSDALVVRMDNHGAPGWRGDACMLSGTEVTRSLFFPTPFLKATLATCPNSRGDIVYMPAFFHVFKRGDIV